MSQLAPTAPTLLQITPEPIDLNALQRAVTTPHDGAVVLFTGAVRGQTGAEITDRLEYEAYTSMAEAKLRQVAEEMRAKFALIHGVALVQRVGEMAVGEPTVAVVVSAGHRGDGAFEAARYGIDRLKQIVPVWKKETRPDGSSWIEGDYTPVRGD
jgi:molybdopterin synthase catalytic subunit